MNDVDAIFFLETMKMSMLGAIQSNNAKLNKFEAAATNGLIAKQVEALEIAIKSIKEVKNYESNDKSTNER